MAQVDPPVFRIPDNDAHGRISALFLGPKAENADRLLQYLTTLVDGQEKSRQSYFPEDADFITTATKESSAYKQKSEQLNESLALLLDALGRYSVPFFHPRYSAHMVMDMSMPAILGYLSAMFYNPNNVAFEASPFTTLLELEVGRQLCDMLGYNTDVEKPDLPLAWGHITCDGSVANLESLWVSRNLKFYPLSLRDAMKNELAFIADSFNITTCKGEEKLFTECTTWELLNLSVSTVVAIPEQIIAKYKISPTYLEGVMNKYLIQTTNKDYVMQEWGIAKEPVLFVPSTKHYSWPKAAAIAGIGSGNAINIPVDTDARMDTVELRRQLLEYATNERAVYEVVAVIGTTEEGAVDRITEIVKIRDELQALGLSFVVHADAAWGGYFASMLGSRSKSRDSDPDSFVPFVGLRTDTAKELEAFALTDSITIDPHKAGYVPYPAGGLCYKDGRMRYLVTWTAPYIDQGMTLGESIGVYGVEGSKPGASASAVYLAHEVIGLTPEGHGTLLGEASFTCRKFAAIWSSMTDSTSDYTVVPLNPLPAESDGSDVDVQKQYIREHIVGKTNAELVEDADAMALLNQLGSDLNINAFACNFRRADGTMNTDIVEANYLNRRIFERLSVTDPTEDPLKVPFYLTSTVFAQADYGVCATKFKQRLQLEGNEDLFVLRNVVMSPFTTERDFINNLGDIFKQVLEEEVANVRARNTPAKAQLDFLVQGTDKPYFVNMPRFHMESGRRQFVFTGDLSADDLAQIASANAAAGTDLARVKTVDSLLLEDVVEGSSLQLTDGAALAITITNVHIVKRRSLSTEDLDSQYPEFMPFYLYGTLQQQHLEHVLLFAPNIQATSGTITNTLQPELTAEQLSTGVIAIAQNIHERSMQPFPANATIDDIYVFESTTREVVVKIYADPYPAISDGPISIDDIVAQGEIATGTIALGDQWYVDSQALNSDALPSEAPFNYNRKGKSTRRVKGLWDAELRAFDDQMDQTA